MADSIFSYIHTKEDAAFLREKLSIVERNLFNVATPVDALLYEVFSLSMADTLLKQAQTEKVQLTDPTKVQAFLQSISQAIQALPMVTVRLAFDPSIDLVRNIGRVFDEVSGSPVVLDIQVNPELIGGVVVEWNGTYKDYSVKKKIENYLVNNHSGAEPASN